MKKIFLALLILGVFLISGCGQNNEYTYTPSAPTGPSEPKVSEEAPKLELSPDKLEITSRIKVEDGVVHVKEGKGYVTLKNLGDKEVRYAVLCGSDDLSASNFVPGYEKYQKEIPGPGLGTWVNCAHNNLWQDTIPSASTHSIDVSYDPNPGDVIGKHETKLRIVVIDEWTGELASLLEVPLIINIAELE